MNTRELGAERAFPQTETWRTGYPSGTVPTARPAYETGLRGGLTKREYMATADDGWTPPPDALVALCRERRSYLSLKRTGTQDSLAAFLLPGAHAYYRRARAAAFQPRRLP